MKRQCNAILTEAAWSAYMDLKALYGKQGTVVSAAILALKMLAREQQERYVRTVNAAYRDELAAARAKRH